MSETFIDIDPEKDAQAKKEFEALYVALAIRYNDFVHEEEINLKQIALPFRAALTGTTVSPGIFEVANVLGQKETMGRLKDVTEI